MVALVPGMVAFWLLAARLLPRGFGQTMVRVSGIFSAVGVAVVAVLVIGGVATTVGLGLLLARQSWWSVNAANTGDPTRAVSAP